MLVVRPRGGGNKKYIYSGTGVFDVLSKTLFSNTMRKIVYTATKSAVTQKVANAVVNGATSGAEQAVKKVVNDAVNHLKPIFTKRKRKEKKLNQSSLLQAKKNKIDINNLIDGSGVVFD